MELHSHSSTQPAAQYLLSPSLTHQPPVIYTMFARVFALAALVAVTVAAPTATAITCATCPLNVTDPNVADVNGQPMLYYLVNRSNSGYGTPTYCGYASPQRMIAEFASSNLPSYSYNQVQSNAWYQVFCFYDATGVRSKILSTSHRT